MYAVVCLVVGWLLAVDACSLIVRLLEHQNSLLERVLEVMTGNKHDDTADYNEQVRRG